MEINKLKQGWLIILSLIVKIVSLFIDKLKRSRQKEEYFILDGILCEI